MKIDYVDYTMWIYTEHTGGYFNGEWEDGQPEEQVIKEWNKLLEDAIAQNNNDGNLDKVLSAELRKHSDYESHEDGITSQRMDIIIQWTAGEEE